MNVSDITLTAKDGYRLAASLYCPASGKQTERTVIISSATAVKRGYYDGFARFLCSHGLSVVTFDYRGIGGSLHGDIRQASGSMRDWGENDLAGVIEDVAARFPASKLLLIGHSAGGQLLGLADNNTRVRALLAVGAQSGYWRLWSTPRRYLLAALWYGFMPVLTHLAAYFPARTLRLGENLPAGVALEWARWCRSREFIVDARGRPIREHFERFDGPILAYSFDDDPMAPGAAVSALMGFYGKAQIERRHVCPGDIGAGAIGHFGFFKARFKSTLWVDSLQWLLQR